MRGGVAYIYIYIGAPKPSLEVWTCVDHLGVGFRVNVNPNNAERRETCNGIWSSLVASGIFESIRRRFVYPGFGACIATFLGNDISQRIRGVTSQIQAMGLILL